MILTKVTLISLGLTLTIILTGCGTDTGNPISKVPPASMTDNAPTVTLASQLLTTICTKFAECHSEVTVDACETAILPNPGWGTTLNLPIDTFQAIEEAEADGTITPITAAHLACRTEIAALSCSDSRITIAITVTSGIPDYSNTASISVPSSSCYGTLY